MMNFSLYVKFLVVFCVASWLMCTSEVLQGSIRLLSLLLLCSDAITI